MQKRRLWIGLSCIVLLILVGLGSFFFFFPAQVSSTFGKPDVSLSMGQVRRLAVSLYLQRGQLTRAKQADSAEPQEFQIQPGESAAQISTRLAQSGFIESDQNFLNYLIYKGYDRILQSGTYFFSAAQTPLELAAAMIDPTPEDVDFVILPGMRLEEIANLIPTSGLSFSSDELLALIQSRTGITLPEVYREASDLEGLILAGKYTILRVASAQEFLQDLIDQSAAQFTPDVVDAFVKQGLTPYQAIIVASLVEREAIQPAEKPAIASVFLNRLKVGMPLQSDPTVQYALGWNGQSNTWWKTPLTRADLEVNSPYNTYRVNGLPPAPICSVSVESLIAVAFPERTDYYYFRSACDGSGTHVFAESYGEHQSNACR
ncbi:MAG: endolytic transglycosylase MltG [Pelolinea sp.]|jgi:UPF0755 protein|nr:endolytic transglycosylase MltG [Pelolinea sp.]